ncbi:hypothetical protein PIB30_092034 [Stylosanthes scabra]|uniref:Ubiquitin-like protease family profile domain-containing protein n=1 Tax=Stylosanthes scabra TaxID=79078 RepID=A0ABU6YSD6_9FABA|nr:hypothetical protein [Stylosanthes scabra]
MVKTHQNKRANSMEANSAPKKHKCDAFQPSIKILDLFFYSFFTLSSYQQPLTHSTLPTALLACDSLPLTHFLFTLFSLLLSLGVSLRVPICLVSSSVRLSSHPWNHCLISPLYPHNDDDESIAAALFYTQFSPKSGENNSSTEKVTLVSLANSIKQSSRQFQSLVQCLEDSDSTPSKVFKDFGSTSKTPNVPEVLQHTSEKAKTESSNAKTGPRHIINQINLPELELPIDSQRTRMDPCGMGFLITEICLGKVEDFKRVFIPVSEINKEDRKHWYLVVVDRLARQVILLDPNPTKCQDRRRRRTATKLATYLEDVLDPLNRYYDNEITPTFSTIGYDFLESEGISKLKDESNLDDDLH